MAGELRHSEPEDPFRDLSRLSLFPLTLGSPLHSAAADAPETQEPEAIQSIFKSMALKGSTELLEQAQAISRSSSNIQNFYSEVDDKAILADGEEGREGPQGRRRALGRQKARFSLKPMPSHSSANSSIDQFFEPQEYFLATEQLQKADEELKKLKGGPVTDPMQHNQSTAVRRHRPGILGRTASYKHHLSVNADATKSLRVSQEVFPDRIPSPAKTSIDLVSGITAKEQSVEDLLEKLLSSFKDMDGGDAVALLQEGLQIKSTEFGKINLTELGSTQKNNLRALKNTMAKRRLDSSQLPQQISPTPTRSPLAVIANLKRHISLKDSLDDPYAMPLGDDTPHSEGPSLSMGRDKQSLSSSEDIGNDVSSGLIVNGACSPVIINGRSSNMDKLQLPLHDVDRSIGNKMTSEQEFAKHSPSLLENRTEHNSSLLGNYEDNIPTELDGALEKEGNDMQLDASVSSQLDPAIKDLTSDYMNQNDTETWANPSNRKLDRNTSSSGIDAFTGSFGHEATFEVEVNVMLEGEKVADPEVPKDSLADPSSRNTDQNDSRSRINVGVRSFGHDVTSQHEVNVTVQGDPASEVEVFKGNLSPPRAVLPVDRHSENLCLLPEDNNETREFQEASGVSPGIGRKRKAPPGGQNKRKPSSKGQSISRRQSLADAGMKWKSGVRRSTRIKSRPLQYWCGERFLYGRIHDSLATVIGLKYASPEKDGKSPVLKVKSYVPRKYADLVSQAAL